MALRMPAAAYVIATAGTLTSDRIVQDFMLRPSQAPKACEGSISARERDVLRLLARGLTNHEIARQLFLSEGTVRNYVTTLFAKLGVSDRTQAAVIALRHGLAD